MRIYSQVFDAVAPTPNRFWVPPYSDFGIGIKILGKDGQALSGVTLSADGEALSAEADKIDGFTIFNTASQGQGAKVYTAKAADLGTPFRLVQVVTDSTVFDKGGSGGSGEPVDAYTKAETDALLSAKADETELTAYATTESLTGYATVESLTAYQPAGDYLTAVPDTYKTYDDTKTQLSTDGFATAEQLTAYVDKTTYPDEVTLSGTYSDSTTFQFKVPAKVL